MRVSVLVHVCVLLCVCVVCVCVCPCLCMCVCVCVCVCPCLCMCVGVCVGVWVCIRTKVSYSHVHDVYTECLPSLIHQKIAVDTTVYATIISAVNFPITPPQIYVHCIDLHLHELIALICYIMFCPLEKDLVILYKKLWRCCLAKNTTISSPIVSFT